MKAVVLGAGFVGLPYAVALSNIGWKVTLVERDKGRIAQLEMGDDYTGEIGDDRLLELVRSGSLYLKADNEAAGAVGEADLVIVAVGTPAEDPSGPVEQIAQMLDWVLRRRDPEMPPVSIVMKSTVAPGTGMAMINRLPKGRFGYIAAPEFLREGTALADILSCERPPITGIENDPLHLGASLAWYRVLRDLTNRTLMNKTFMAGVMRVTEAELVKLSSNSMLAARVGLANELAELARDLDCNGHVVLRGVGADPRIGDRYLSPGPGFAGPCLPKDLSMLRGYGATPVFDAIAGENRSRAINIARRIFSVVNDLPRRVAVMVGLGFKPGSEDIRTSIAGALMKSLDTSGVSVMQVREGRPHDYTKALSEERVIVLHTDPNPTEVFRSALQANRSGVGTVSIFDLRGAHIELFTSEGDFIPSCVGSYESPGYRWAREGNDG